jgi:hypothetical protein
MNEIGTLALRGNFRHAMQQETYAFLERKTPELPQGLGRSGR